MSIESEKPDLFGMAFVLFFQNDTTLDYVEKWFLESLSSIKVYSNKFESIDKTFSLEVRLIFEFTKLNEVLLKIYKELYQKKERKENNEFSGVEFFFEYRKPVFIKIGEKDIVLLNQIFGSYNIALNSIDNSWSDENESYYQETYYQIILQSKHELIQVDKIKHEYFDLFGEKYSDYFNIQMLSDNENEINLSIILSMKWDVNMFAWNEQFNDMIKLLKNYMNKQDENELLVYFGVYQQNRDSMNGGEIPHELLLNIKTDFFISCGDSPYNHLG